MKNKDNNGGNQVEDCRYEGSEEIAPGPAEELYLGVHITRVDDKKKTARITSPTDGEEYIGTEALRYIRIIKQNIISANKRILFWVYEKLVQAAQH